MSRIKNVLEYLETSAHNHPDKTVFADETQSITYSELVSRAKGMATVFAKLTPPRTPVAVLGEKNIHTLCAFFACVYAGCFYVPLNPRHPAERREKILRTLGSPLVWAQESMQGLLPEWAKERMISGAAAEGEADEKLLGEIRARQIDTDPLYVMFTSGSTGTPKGIAVSHRSVIDFIEEFVPLFGIGEEDVIANQAPFDFDVSVKDIYSTLKAGATMQVLPKKLFSFPAMLIDYLIERGATTLIWAVSALCILSTLNAFEYKVPDRIDKVLFSGEAMPVPQLNVWKKYFPQAMFVNLYGPTEITCNCTYHILEKGPYEKEVLPIGRPFPNERVFLLDEAGKQVTAAGATGEICVTGTALSLGYYNAPEETAAAFVQNPLNPAFLEPVYKTGDLAYYDEEGNLCFVGRKDFQIKHQGHRIELAEIENAMFGLAQIRRAVCLYDNAADKIVAFYCGDEDPARVRVYLRGRLPSYMVPHRCVAVEAFELTENGKIDRKKLKEKYF